MTGGIGGTFDDQQDFYKFLEHTSEKATNYEGDDWNEPDQWDTLPESMEQVVEKLEELYNRGYISPCSESFAVNDQIRSYAKNKDDFDRAKQNNENIEDPKIIKEGADLIHSKLFNTLQSKGLKAMDSKETPFDVDLHDAITNIPAPSKQLKGKVVDVIEKGYYLNDHVLRFAKVVVGQ